MACHGQGVPSLLSRVAAGDSTAKPLGHPVAGWYCCPASSSPAPEDSRLSAGGRPSHQKGQHTGFGTLRAHCWLPALLQRKPRRLPKACLLRIPRRNFTVNLCKVFAAKLVCAAGSLPRAPRTQPTEVTLSLASPMFKYSISWALTAPIPLTAKQVH